MRESEDHSIQVIAASADLFDGDPDSDRVDCANVLDLKFILSQSSGATGTATITISKHTADAAAGTAIDFEYRTVSDAGVVGAWTAIAAATGYPTIAGAEKTVEFRVKLKELGDTYRYVYLTATELVNSPVAGIVTAQLKKRTV